MAQFLLPPDEWSCGSSAASNAESLSMRGEPMFQKILVPVDLSETHQNTVRIAAQLAESTKGSGTLLHVVETMYGLGLTEEREFYNRLERRARAHLEKLRATAQANANWRVEVLFGKPASEVMRFAADNAIDLIVLTSHRINLENLGEGWGTLSYKIGILSQCPVLLVK
ncbi:MAG: universal stress protein [Acidobacteria bacterium]|nr:MAG: universal stress protein [Acidobacteriota bacterium]